MVIGGVAVSLLGTPRFTRDIDVVLLVEEKDFSQFLEEVSKMDLVPRITDAEMFAKRSSVFLLQHKGSGVWVDVAIGILPFEKDAIRRSKKLRIGELVLRIPTPEDLIILKAVAHRPQDLLDIQGIINANPKLSGKYILKILREFSAVLEMPEVYDDVERLLRR